MLSLIVVLALSAAAFFSVRPWRRQQVAWRPSYEAAVAEAKDSAKPIFLYFGAKWCAPCNQMDRDTWSDSEVGQVMREVVPVKLDYDVRANRERFDELHGAGLPSYLILTANGKVIATGAGYRSPDEFIKWLTDGLGKKP